MDKVTVAIPTYNGEAYLESAIQSIVNQTYKNIKIYIVDDNSTDSTLNILERIKNSYPFLELFVNKNPENQGYASNWNNCLRISDSKYLVILHQDDMLQEYCIETQLKSFVQYPDLAIIGGLEDTINEQGKIIIKANSTESKIYPKGHIYEFIKEKGSYIPCSSVMFDMSKIHQIGYFKEDVLATDELYWPKVLQSFPIAILGESLILRRKHKGQTEYSDFKNKKKQVVEWGNHFKAIENYEIRPTERKKLKKLIQIKISNGLTGNIFRSSLLYHKSPSLAFYYLFYGIKTYPIIIFQIRFWRRLLKSSLLMLLDRK